MYWAVIGFILGAVLVLAGFFLVQREVIRTTADSIDYSFSRYVFSDPEFPANYFGAGGRVVTRMLFPVRVKVTYYDRDYREVTRADKPGRYGAVVRLDFNGGVTSYRFITLFRTPEKIYWGDNPGSISGITLPPGVGLNPDVVQRQEADISRVMRDSFLGVSPRSAMLFAGLSETSPQDPPAVGANNVIVRDRAWWHGLRKKLGLEAQYPRLVHLPTGYDADPAKKWPLLLYLHSNANAGKDLRLLREHELLADTEQGASLPAVVVTPQCSPTDEWSLPALFEMLDEIMGKYRIDPAQVYLAGSSTGADYVVGMASQHPEKFAAIATVAGESDFLDAAKIKDVPYWAFEGADDQVMDPTNPAAMIEAIRAAGGTKVHFTLYPGLGHGCWDKAFTDPALWRWLFAQKLGQPEAITPGLPPPQP